MKHRPRKRFGQNFLVDEWAIAAIVDAISPQQGDNLVEIGPVLGALTRPLLARVNELRAIEIDRDLASRLQHDFGGRLDLYVTEVLAFDFSMLGNGLRVVGNLPYNISSPLLFRLIEFIACIRDIHVMLQREVVARMVAAPGDSDYGRLTVMLQYRFEMEKLLDISAAAFDPAPQVDSAVVRLLPRSAPALRARDERAFSRVVAAAFSQRRKTLRNSLANLVSDEDFEKVRIAPTARAQELSVAQFVALADGVAGAQSAPDAAHADLR